MKWIKLSLKTTVEAEDLVTAVLDEMGIEGVQIEDKVQLSEEDKKKMFIDILPELQHTGCGRRLVEAFLDALREKNVPGIHLGVSSDNLNAQGFYKKLGFSVLEGDKYGMVLGMKL